MASSKLDSFKESPSTAGQLCVHYVYFYRLKEIPKLFMMMVA